MTTPLYPTFQKRIQDAVGQIITKQVMPWAFLHSGKPMRVTRFDGRAISYQGIGFEGSPRHVFWFRYIEPFMEHLCETQISAAVAMSRERQIDGTLVLPEVQELLISAIHKIYSHMAEIDQRLLGKGYPEKIVRRSVDNEIKAMTDFIEVRIRAEIRMWRRPWFQAVEVWCERNKGLLTVIGIAATILGLIFLLF